MTSDFEARRIWHILIPAVCIFIFFVFSIFMIIVPYVEARLIEQKRRETRDLITSVYTGLSYFQKRVDSEVLTLEEAQASAIEQIRSLRYGDDGTNYFWINDFQPVVIMHPYRPDLEGQDVGDYEDANGKKLFAEFVEIAESNGQGYVDYMWQWMDDPNRIAPKISYVRAFEPWGWIIGTGAYLEDVRQELASTRKTLAAICGGIFLISGALCIYLIWRANVQESRRRETQKLLRESEETFRALAEGAGDTIMRFDRAHRHLYVNHTVTQDTGIPVEEFIGKTHAELGFPDELVQLWEEAIDYVFNTGNQTRREFRLPKGPWIDWMLAPEFDSSGNVQAVITAARDITERKEAEERLRNSEEQYRYLVENANSIILRMDTKGNITFLNEFGLQYFGFKEEEIIGRSVIGTIVAPNDASGRDLELMIQEICLHPEQYAANQNENITKEGKRVWIAWSNKAILDKSGNPIEILCVGNDISLQRHLQHELRQSQKLEAVGTLAGGIAHDFNNLLWAISGNIELALMNEDASSEQNAASLQQALTAASRAKELVAQILAFSRQQEEKLGPMHITPVLEETTKLLRASIPATIEMSTAFDAAEDVIRGDATQVQQILMNLCTNAVHAMSPQGGILGIASENINISSKDQEKRPSLRIGPYYQFTVSDTGDGIPEEISDRILEPYFTTKEVGEGTGLGLSVVHGIVESFGGYLFFQSQPSMGTVFTVLLPLVQAITPEIESNLPAEMGTEHVLLVDDQEEVRTMLGRLLEKFGYHVTSCSCGAEALKVFDESEERIDLVVTDRTMPGMTGEKLAQELVNRKPDLPIILCTGYAGDAEDSATRIPGVREIINKPISAKLLSQAIRRHLSTNTSPSV